MRHILSLLCIIPLLAGCSKPDIGALFEDYLWQERVILVFAPALDDENYKAQIKTLSDNKAGLKTRDIVLWQFVHLEHILVNGQRKPQLPTPPFYKEFAVKRGEFAVILIGKDGEEKLRRYDALSIDELFSTIDAMPMRQNEMR